MYHHRARRARWHKLLMTPRGVTTNDETRCPPANRSLTVAAPIDVTAIPLRAATVRERLPGERLFSRKAPPCASERSSDTTCYPFPSYDGRSPGPMAVSGSVGGGPRVLARRAVLRTVRHPVGPARLPSTSGLVRRRWYLSWVWCYWA